MKANTGHFIKSDLHEPCFLWNAFPELSLDMTCEANCTGAFYKHLRFGFGIWDFLRVFTSIFWFFSGLWAMERVEHYVSMGEGREGKTDRREE